MSDWFFKLWFAFVGLMMLAILVMAAIGGYRTLKLAERMTVNTSVTTTVSPEVKQ